MSVGNVWQRIALILLCVCLSSSLVASQGVAGEAGAEGADAGGENAGPRPAERGVVCQYTTLAFVDEIWDDPDLFSRWLAQLRTSHPADFYFASKPFTPYPTTVCSGINTTCCKPPAEKEMLHVTILEYKKIYHSVMEEELAGCPHIGRNFYHAMYSTLTEVRRQLEIEVNQTLNYHLPNDAFTALFNYFAGFLYTPDLCPLAGTLQTVIQELFKAVYIGQGGEDMRSSPERMSCFRNASNSFTFLHLQEILTPLERQLYDLKLFIDSLKMAEEIMHTVRGHTFSHSCVNALPRLKYCAYCGGFRRFKPCLFFCLNTFRGCLADIAELHQDFSHFLTALKTVSRDFAVEWQPETLISNSLRYFVTLSTTLKTTDLKAWVASECGEHPVVQERQKRNFLEATSQLETSTPFTSGPGIYNLLPNAIMVEVECMEKLKNLMLTIPEEMCYLSKRESIAHIANDVCWTGSSLGRYDDPQVGVLKSEQKNNTAFQHLPLEPELQYLPEMVKLRQLTSLLNESIHQRLCFESDDEDCVKKVLYMCDTNGLPDFSASGSGSGLGSGNRSDTENPVPNTVRPVGNTNEQNRPDVWLDDSNINDGVVQRLDPFNVTEIPDNTNTDDDGDNDQIGGVEILEPTDNGHPDPRQDELTTISSAKPQLSTLRIPMLIPLAYMTVRMMIQ